MNDTKPHPLILCDQVCKSYRTGTETLQVLSQINLSVTAGELIAITGSSGSGKSTLLNLLGALDNPDSGTLELLSQPLHLASENERARLRNQNLGFVYQFHHLLKEFNASENVAMPLLIGGLKRSEANLRAEEMLSQVGLSQRLRHRPSELSGGEKQRVAIARALVGNPVCVLMDEPTGNLDQANSDSVLQLIHQLNERLETAFIIATHDEQLASSISRRLLLTGGRLQALSD